MMIVVFPFILALFLTLLAVPLCASIAFRINLLDIPDGKVKKHEKPIPYLGGLALYGGFVLPFLLVGLLESHIVFLLLGSSLLLLVGLIDDMVALMPHQKWLGQVFASVYFIEAGFYLKEQFFLSHSWSIPLSALWILTITNAFNLVDVMDGLATTIAISAATSFLVLAILFNQSELIFLFSAFLGALFGFLWYNWPPAKIYLGDTGSLFIGGFLATVPFLFDWGVHAPFGFLAPVIILGIPLLELVSLIVIRSYKGIPFYKASPDHFSMYLRVLGWSKQRILFYVYGASLILLVMSLLIAFDRISIFSLIFIMLAGLILCVSLLCKNYILHF
jgi:UDP-GlcNAc:undecaprenyl-phosphate GlcNAc-1-phosphate transferase